VRVGHAGALFFDRETGEILFDAGDASRRAGGPTEAAPQAVAGLQVVRRGPACAVIHWDQLTPEHVRARARAAWVMTPHERRQRASLGLRQRSGMPNESSRDWCKYWGIELPAAERRAA
jgi:hypothetical protein